VAREGARQPRQAALGQQSFIADDQDSPELFERDRQIDITESALLPIESRQSNLLMKLEGSDAHLVNSMI
jgi:hypothetical protein